MYHGLVDCIFMPQNPTPQISSADIFASRCMHAMSSSLSQVCCTVGPLCLPSSHHYCHLPASSSMPCNPLLYILTACSLPCPLAVPKTLFCKHHTTTITTPAMKAKKQPQKTQQMHVRRRRLACWRASQESLHHILVNFARRWLRRVG